MDISPSVVAAIISAATAVFVSLSSDRIRLWLTKPKLEAKYVHESGGYRIANTESRIFIRVKISNKSKHVAKSCQAYLVGVELLDSKKGILHDTPILEWPHRGYGGINIIKSVDQFLNIAYSLGEFPTQMRFAASFKPSHLTAFERSPENCRVKIALITENGHRTDFALDLIWNGSWDKLDAKPFSTVRRLRASR